MEQELIAALEARAWYPLAGILVTLALAAWKRLGPDNLVGWLPRRWQWLPPVLVPALGAFAESFGSGETWLTAVVVTLYAGASAGLVAIGAHHTSKRVAGQ